MVSMGLSGSARRGWSAGRRLTSAVHAAVRLTSRPSTGVRESRTAFSRTSYSRSLALRSESRIGVSGPKNSPASNRPHRLRWPRSTPPMRSFS